MIQPLHIQPARLNYNFSSVSFTLVSGFSDNYIIFVWFLLVLSIFMLVKYLKPIFNSFYNELIIGVLLATLSFVAPTFQYICMLFFSSIALILTFPYFDTYLPVRKKVALLLFQLSHQIGFHTYLERLYIQFFGQPNRPFFIQTMFIYLFCFLYVLISKYLFLNQSSLLQQDKNTLFLLYLYLFVCTISIYYRILLSASIINHNISYNFLKTEEIPSEPKEISSTGPSKTTGNPYSLFTFKKSTTNHYQQAATNASRFRLVGLGVGICTLCIGGYAAYQQRLQTIAAQESVVAQQVNNHEMARQNDLEELSQGIISRKDYIQKYPPKK